MIPASQKAFATVAALHNSRYMKHGRGFEIIGLSRCTMQNIPPEAREDDVTIEHGGTGRLGHPRRPTARRNHATTKETICKDCEKLKKKMAVWRDLAGRYKASIDALYGRLREARVARADRTKSGHNSRI